MRTRMYGGVRGRRTKVGGKPTFVFLLLDFYLLPLCIPLLRLRILATSSTLSVQNRDRCLGHSIRNSSKTRIRTLPAATGRILIP